MSGTLTPTPTLTIPSDAICTVPLIFDDQFGRVTIGTGGAATSSDPTVVTASLTLDEKVQITPVASSGSATVTFTDGAMTASLTVTIVAPTPSVVAFDPKDATFAPKI